MSNDSKYGATSAQSRDPNLAVEIEGSYNRSSTIHGYTNHSALQNQDWKNDERTRLLGSRANDSGATGTAAGSRQQKRRSWFFAPGQQPHTLLPTSTVSSAASAPEMRIRPKELPGQTKDPLDPLNRTNTTSSRINRERFSRQESAQSFVTTASLINSYPTSISARRNQLHLQNTFGEQPNIFIEYVYWIKDLVMSPDSTDEKITSTVLNVINVVVDTVFCILYLVEANSLTRPPGYESHWLYIQRSKSFWHILVAIAIYNFITVVVGLTFSESKMISIRSTRHIVSTLVAVPFIISIFIEDGHELYVPYFLQSFALISRVQQALNFYIDIGVSDLPMDPLKSKTVIFALYIITLIYCAISAFQVAEYDQLMGSDDHNDLLKLLYFVLITMSTIGYGDVTPKNQLGYAIVILVIIAVVTVFPWMISGIMDALAQAKAGEGIFKSGGQKFMIISGSLHSAQKLANVLNGFWFTNKEYTTSACKIVILGLSEPSKEIEALLQSARYKNRVIYLKGTPLESKDLERIQAKHAEGIFIIADRHSPHSAQEEDRHITLSTLAFRNVSDAGIYTYNLLPETEIYQKLAATQVVCADELRQVLLAFNCLQQATATLILNLLHQHRPSESFSEAWEAEYDDSLGNEFYISYLNPIFVGKPFGFVSWFLYRRFQVMLFGIRIRLQSGEYHTALNPGKDYCFQHNEQCIFIAQNPTDLDDINELDEKKLENFLQHLHQTREEDVETIGLDYHAKNFSKALLTLMPTNRFRGKQRRTRSSRTDSSNSYTRTAGRFQLHSAMPTITNEDDEIDVEPEVSFMSDTEGSGAEQGSNEPQSSLATAPAPTLHVISETIAQAPQAKENEAMKKKYEVLAKNAVDEKLENMKRQDDKAENLRVGYPPAPFPGAKMPLCTLVDSRKETEQRMSDMIISSWGDLLKLRDEKAGQMESESGSEAQPNFTEGGSSKSDSTSSTPSQEPGHILICSPNYDIFRLICTLRSVHLRQLQDVVILCPRQPTAIEFKFLRAFPRLYFLIGDCLSRDDLERGAITKSSKYLFLRHPENAGVDGSFFDSVAVINRILVQQIFSDAQIARVSKLGRNDDRRGKMASSATYDTWDPSVVLPTTKKAVSLQTINEGPQCVYELVEERSVEFLQIRKTDISVENEGQYISGPKTILDGAGAPIQKFGPETDSGYYGHPVHEKSKHAGSLDFYHNPIYASGGVLVGGLLDHVLYQLYSNPSILQLIKLLCGIRTKADVKRDFHLFKQYGAGCYLECIPVPDGFGVQTIRPPKRQPEHGDGSFNTAFNDDDSSGNDEADGNSPNKKRSKKVGSSFSKAASLGKQRISEFFHNENHRYHHHHGRDNSGNSSDSIDSEYIYDNRHKNFLHLYEHLALDQGVIPIGLLRLQGDDPKTVHLGIGGSSRCYAITNPLLDTIILDTDQVFVLTREDE
ncbi:hypothetical protein BGZ46_008945 [Entomortierella lignicola]|nr:hypothetical protein BGZ46_008945 [Entomortierella lignicola]